MNSNEINLKCSVLIICLSILVTTSGISQEFRLLSKPGLLPEIHGVIEKPSTLGSHPAVIILYGVQGWLTIYAKFAKDLADSGFVAIALDYFAFKESGSLEIGDLAVWLRRQAAVRCAVNYLLEDSSSVNESCCRKTH